MSLNAYRRLMLFALLGALAPCAFAATPPIPDTPTGVIEVVSVRPFTLDVGYRHLWRAEQPMVKSGYVLVLRVDPDLVYPRQVEQPVLFVGDQTAERLNVGYPSGYVVALVPSPLDPKQPGYVDLATSPIWFGAPAMPETVNAETIARERAKAQAAGLRPTPRAALDAAVARGGALAHRAGKNPLLDDVATLVERVSPTEFDLVSGLRAAAQAPVRPERGTGADADVDD